MPATTDMSIMREPLLISIDNRIYSTNNWFLGTLATRLNLQGLGLRIPSEEVRISRDEFFSKLLNDAASEYTLIYRQVPETLNRRAMALASKGYCYIPQAPNLIAIINKCKELLGECDVTFEIDNNETVIRLTFWEKAEDLCMTYRLKRTIAPSVVIRTSDVLKSSLIVEGSIRTMSGDGAVFDCISAKHEDNFNLQKFLEKLEKSLFPRFTKEIDRYVQLLSINLEDPRETLREVLADFKFEKEIGKRNTAQIERLIYACMNEQLNWTAYDFCLLLLNTIGKIENMCKSDEEAYAKLIAKVIWYDFKSERNLDLAI